MPRVCYARAMHLLSIARDRRQLRAIVSRRRHLSANFRELSASRADTLRTRCASPKLGLPRAARAGRHIRAVGLENFAAKFIA